MSIQETGVLPGGWRTGCVLEKHIAFRRVDGYVEEALLEIGSEAATAPQLVTKLLSIHVERIGDQPFGVTEAAQLCVADRQWLIMQLARRMHGDHRWLHAVCGGCAATIDIPLDLSALPVKNAGVDFPEMDLELGNKRLTLRLPTGDDQEQIAMLQSDEEALKALLRRCVVAVDGACPHELSPLNLLTETELEAIEQALETASPAVTTILLAGCPECGHQQQVQIDLLELCQDEKNNLLHEIHVLATQYHWGEREILSLPRERRRAYLRLIDHNRGLVS